MKIIFFVFTIFLTSLSLANGLNAINDPVMNPCIQRPNLAGCGSNNSPQTRQVINIPNRWGAIYYNAANRAVGYSENNTKGYRSANKEALQNCIKAGGGQDPKDENGEGCGLMTEYRNACGAIALGGKNRGAARSAVLLEDAEQQAIAACEKGRSYKCTIYYSGCSRHPSYRY